MKENTKNIDSILNKVKQALENGEDIYTAKANLDVELTNKDEIVLDRAIVRPVIILDKDEEGDTVLPLTSQSEQNEYKKVKLNPDDVTNKRITKRDSYIMGKLERMDNADRKNIGQVKSESIFEGFFGKILKKLS